MTRTEHTYRFERGFTLVELLLTLLLTGIITIAAMKFYISEHRSSLTQQNVANMQQSLRASFDAISRSITNAGANLPGGLLAVEGANTNPDTLMVRFAPMGSALSVASASTKDVAAPIRIAAGTDMSAFAVNDRVYFWHESQNQGSWINISSISINNGSAWELIYHAGQVLLFDPAPSDQLIKLSSLKYYLDASDTTNPLLMMEKNAEPAIIFADGITDFQIDYYLNTNDTVQSLTVSDTATMVRLTMSAQTAEVDHEAVEQGLNGRRFRTLSTEVAIRNNRN